MAYKLKAPQHTAYDAFYKKRPSRKFVMVAGRRCRKSTLLLILHAETCIKSPGVQTAYVAPVEKGLADYISPIIGVVFGDCPDDLLPRFREKSNDLLFPNGSRTVFNGCNMRQYRYMRGQKLMLATVDEMAEVDDLESAVDDVLFPATWDSHGELVLSGTPPPVPSPDNPVIRYVEAAKMADSYWHATVYEGGYSYSDISKAICEMSKGDIGEKEAQIIVEVCDPRNGFSVEQIYQQVEAQRVRRDSLTKFLREFMAEFIRDESAVIVPEFSEVKHVQALEKPAYYRELYKTSGADLGVADKTVALFGYVDFPNGRLVVEREFYLQGADVRTDNFAQRYRSIIAELGWEGHPHVQHWSDNSNLMLLNDLSVMHDVHISPTEKEQKGEWLNKLRILFGQNRIIIDPSCKLLIATLNGAFWKDALKKNYGRSAGLGHMDALDALIYMTRNAHLETNPFPVNYDVSRGTIYDGAQFVYPPNWNKIPHTPNGRVLSKVFGKERFGSKPVEQKIMGGL